MPCYYDGKQWVGQTEEELAKSLPKIETPVDNKDIAIAELTNLVVDLQEEVNDLKQTIARLTEEQANQKLGKHNMDKVVIDLYKKNYTLTKLSKSLLELVGLPEQFKETTGKDYEPQVK